MITHFLSLAELRQIELQALEEGLPLMERAGRATAELALQWSNAAQRILVLVGPGNNGGDGLVCARELQDAGLEVTVCRPSEHADFFRADLIIDALFGIGLARDLNGDAAALVEAANASGKPILAIDTPSGLDAYTGTIRGTAIRAHKTLTFIADKPGLHTGAGRDCAGEVHVERLGLHLPSLSCEALGELVRTAPAALQTLRRSADTHKGHFGTLAIFGGATGMLGAPLLAGRAALKLGAGKVWLGFLAEDYPAIDLQQPELMLHGASELLAMNDHTHCVAGPGFGQGEASCVLLESLLAASQPLLLDADALNLIARHRHLQASLSLREHPALLTPHPAEAARLLGSSTRQIQADRIAAARTLAQQLNSIVLLKGAGSVCSDGIRWSINASGNAALSNAGQGDALAGIAMALHAQGLDGFDALQGAAWLHGAAADIWRERHPAGIGLTASEVIDLARDLLNRQLAA